MVSTYLFAMSCFLFPWFFCCCNSWNHILLKENMNLTVHHYTANKNTALQCLKTQNENCILFCNPWNHIPLKENNNLKRWRNSKPKYFKKKFINNIIKNTHNLFSISRNFPVYKTILKRETTINEVNYTISKDTCS